MPILDITFSIPLPIALTKFLRASYALTFSPLSTRSCSMVSNARYGLIASAP